MKVTIEFSDGSVREYSLSEILTKMVEKDGKLLTLKIMAPPHGEILTAEV